ncbi:MAG: hypothetical protein ACO239_05830 [Sediminibacterium sp.]|jgi:hypothetical protein
MNIQQNQQDKKEIFLEVLEKHLGIVSQATKKLNIDRSTPYKWMREDPDFAEKVHEIQNLVLDFTESKLYELIRDGNPTAIIFMLKTKGKDRGYVERKEITGMNGKSLDVNIEVINKLEE